MPHDVTPRSTTTPPETPGREPPADALFEALAHEHRRIVLEHLGDRESSVSVSALTEYVSEVAEEDRSDSEIALRHRHLPKLEDAGLLTVGPESATVAPTPAIAAARPHLELLDG